MFISEFFGDTNLWLDVIYSGCLLDGYFSIRITILQILTERGWIGLRQYNDNGLGRGKVSVWDKFYILREK